MQFETKVLGGLPVTVEYLINGRWEIVQVAKKPCKKPKWIFDRLTDKERESIQNEIRYNLNLDKLHGNH